MQEGPRTLDVIQRPVTAKSLGGHAFAIVGYNEVGFLVQNSWGPDWGNGGFATLPYDDWFDSVYDAWVARPGVPQTPFYRGRTRTSVATGGELVDRRRARPAPAGDARRQPRQRRPPLVHGQVREHARARSTGWSSTWTLARLLAGARPATRRNVVLYAHGGGVTETSGLDIAQRQLNWWLNNAVYPISFAWETGPGKTLAERDRRRGQGGAARSAASAST